MDLQLLADALLTSAQNDEAFASRRIRDFGGEADQIAADAKLGASVLRAVAAAALAAMAAAKLAPPPPSQIYHLSTDPLESLEFKDQASGRKCLTQTWGRVMWLFWQHPEGNWVSWRKVTPDDRQRIEKAYAASSKLSLSINGEGDSETLGPAAGALPR